MSYIATSTSPNSIDATRRCDQVSQSYCVWQVSPHTITRRCTDVAILAAERGRGGPEDELRQDVFVVFVLGCFGLVGLSPLPVCLVMFRNNEVMQQ